MIRVDPTRQLIPKCYGGAHLLISCSSFSSRSPPFDDSSLNFPGSRLGIVGERNHAQTLPLREAGIPDSEASFLAFLGAPSDGTGVATIVNYQSAHPGRKAGDIPIYPLQHDDHYPCSCSGTFPGSDFDPSRTPIRPFLAKASSGQKHH